MLATVRPEGAATAAAYLEGAVTAAGLGATMPDFWGLLGIRHVAWGLGHFILHHVGGT
jgi:hypothetical protein